MNENKYDCACSGRKKNGNCMSRRCRDGETKKQMLELWPDLMARGETILDEFLTKYADALQRNRRGIAVLSRK